MQPKEIFFRFLWEPAKQNLVLLITFGGLLLILLGGVFGSSIDRWALAPTGTGESILKVGSALLGGGVFAAIMKGRQFNEIFMNNISAVHYNPVEVLPHHTLRSRWVILTGSILRSTLPETYKSAAYEIANQFLGEELKYHFECLEIRYELELDDKKPILTVKQTSVSKVIISPRQKDVVLKQKIQVDGEFVLKDLLVNGEKVDIEEHVKQSEEDPTRYEFSLDLLKFDIKENQEGDRYIQLQRTYEYSQNVIEDPNIMLDLVRYVKGLVVKVKLSGPGRFDLIETGTKLFSSPEPFSCGEGWTWYTMAGEEQLLLPGQGYILTVVRD